jgi:integrase
MRTTFTEEISKSGATDTALTQEKAETAPEPMKYPVKVKHRGQVLARIYKPAKAYPLYRLAWNVAGQRRMKAFPSYSAAKRHADELVKELAKGSQSTLLTAGQARDALAALGRLDDFFVSTGRRVSLLAGISEYCEAAARLPDGRTLAEALDGYLSTVATVKRQDLATAVEEFIAAEAPRTKSSEGQRAQLSAKYAYNRAIMLRRFAEAFPGNAVSDLAKGHLDAFIAALANAKSKSRNRRAAGSAKSRNHHRAAIRQFLQWCVRKDYLAANHRLGEADAMRPEHANNAEVEFYTPKEFRALLETAEGPMRAMVALGGLAGLRTAELLRLDWADVWRVRGHIEVSAGKAKTRQRRLVEIVPALAAWLAQFRNFTSGKLCTLHEITWQQHFVALCESAKVQRKANGLRHAFCSFHFALHGNENLTAQQAGNSPQMVHAHYKGLATKQEARKWFAVKPAKSAGKIVALPVATGGAA